MKIIISVAMSLDGCIDDCSPERLKLSGSEDWEQVTALRAQCDAILVGAGTVRRDNPSLVIRDEELRRSRAAEGKPEDIMKVTVTGSGDLDTDASFFTEGAGRKVVFASYRLPEDAEVRLSAHAEVVRAEEITAGFIVQQLEERGVNTLMVEGGTSVLSMFLQEGMVDEMRVAVAPFFVGEKDAPKFICPGDYPWTKDRRMTLVSVEMSGDMTVMNFKTKRK